MLDIRDDRHGQDEFVTAKTFDWNGKFISFRSNSRGIVLLAERYQRRILAFLHQRRNRVVEQEAVGGIGRQRRPSVCHVGLSKSWSRADLLDYGTCASAGDASLMLTLPRPRDA